MIFDKTSGVSIDLPDNQGNTPLHFAAKYGHVELCKVLLERGSSLSRKNKQNQNAYDISENHIVRQYLLPLVFQAERSQPPEQMQQQQPTFQSSVTSANVTEYAAAPAPPPSSSLPMPSMMNPFQSRQGLPTAATSTNSGAPFNSTAQLGPPPQVPFAAQGIVPPVYRPQQQGPPQLAGAYSNVVGGAKPSGGRTFQPGGKYTILCGRVDVTALRFCRWFSLISVGS